LPSTVDAVLSVASSAGAASCVPSVSVDSSTTASSAGAVSAGASVFAPQPVSPANASDVTHNNAISFFIISSSCDVSVSLQSFSDLSH